MKYVVALFLGLIAGIAMFAVGLIYNPFAATKTLSPVSVTDSATIALGYSAVANQNILYTNNGETRIGPHPEKVLQLWESPIRKTSALVTVLRDARGQSAGLGIKFSSLSERTRLLNGEALVDSVWYVYLPDRGGFFIEQSENYLGYLRDIVLPAYRSSTKSWKGTWLGDISNGPGALGTATVTGSSGDYSGVSMHGLESLSVKAWSVDSGPVAADGRLIIELPSTKVAGQDKSASGGDP